ncbi:uncharacterized protein FOMMEDRAFT_152070 [Fomitiporia mediterranea MF3/22]|uniref:uncharacterized protein n=1 Tax=Fomitiporia mediterranea (strain MF3/22) TaxID=694068 RepID=UPI0004408350|nr:uncharacterized protein FOMMEDRAFT_152070 [Fomitiporia mediterranea MF3/22]EJD06759.1 hypothetical protein FOMMEDRAFT_152070 [Fomitiporia mediterranea MF3/22]
MSSCSLDAQSQLYQPLRCFKMITARVIHRALLGSRTERLIESVKPVEACFEWTDQA